MKRIEKIRLIREKLKLGKYSIGSWMQIPNSSVAEIMGDAGYDWVAIDLEHGSISAHILPDLFRALEINNTLPLVRLAQGHSKDCKQALDAGAGGVIIPMIESAEQLEMIQQACSWPPSGKRGVGFSRANLFGKYFDDYSIEAQQPLVIAMIEHVNAVNNLDSILQVRGLDGILIGPYDLSSSMGITGQFDKPEFELVMQKIHELCSKYKIPSGIHVVSPDPQLLLKRLSEGYLFVAYSIDTVFMNHAFQIPIIK
jgi:2-dehydro-3-deoxyglucarate aldolase